jgi:hypothetical protein
MSRLKPWFEVVKPREDLREGRPLDASEFAVHLDQVREHRGSADYSDPARFFERTYLTANLKKLSVEVLRRLSGINVETSAVFNMSTQFGGGKTHALTLLYHLATAGPAATRYKGVGGIIDAAQPPGSPVKITAVPVTRVAVFVGTEFDSLAGRGGDDGTPRRYTPWGELAWQLGPDSFAAVARHDAERKAPGGDVLRAMLPTGPVLILMDELMNYVSRTRTTEMGGKFYDFLQNLSETARGEEQKVLVISVPKSETTEMSVDDQEDFFRLQKLLERLSKPVVMSVESETSEIIRRRLFEWGGAIPEEGRRVVEAFSDWAVENRAFLGDGDVSQARERFEATYPFHPAVLSVFERKWQSLPSFQRTRGVLRLLALWVSKSYQEGYRKTHPDPLIGLGTAPLDDPDFRHAIFAELGNDRLEGPVTTDIAGGRDSHAVRLDRDAPEPLRKARLHSKAATAILFESNGGATRTEATLAEIRFALGEPDLNLADVEPVLDALTGTCYYLTATNNRYRISLSPNLVMLLAGKRAEVTKAQTDGRVGFETQALFKSGPTATGAGAIDRVLFPKSTEDIPDRAVLTLVVLDAQMPMDDPGTMSFVQTVVREHGSMARVYKNALVFAVPSTGSPISEEARKVIAIEEIENDADLVARLDDSLRADLPAQAKKARRDLIEACWRAYRYLLVLGKDGELRTIDLGLVHSSAAATIVDLMVTRLVEDGELTRTIGSGRLLTYWPGALDEGWTTKAVRDAFYASPQLPRLTDSHALLRAIDDAVTQGLVAYAGRTSAGGFRPIYLATPVPPLELEFSDDWVLLRPEIARRFLEPPRLERLEVSPSQVALLPGAGASFLVHGFDQHGDDYPTREPHWSSSGGKVDGSGRFAAESPGFYTVTVEDSGRSAEAQVRVSTVVQQPRAAGGGLSWSGRIPPQKWTQFYTRVLTKLVGKSGLELHLELRVPPEGEVTEATRDEVATALRELGLDDDLREG